MYPWEKDSVPGSGKKEPFSEPEEVQLNNRGQVVPNGESREDVYLARIRNAGGIGTLAGRDVLRTATESGGSFLSAAERSELKAIAQQGLLHELNNLPTFDELPNSIG